MPFRGVEVHYWKFEDKISMKIKVYNQNGEEAGEAELPKEIFEDACNSDVVHQVVVA